MNREDPRTPNACSYFSKSCMWWPQFALLQFHSTLPWFAKLGYCNLGFANMHFVNIQAWYSSSIHFISFYPLGPCYQMLKGAVCARTTSTWWVIRRISQRKRLLALMASRTYCVVHVQGDKCTLGLHFIDMDLRSSEFASGGQSIIQFEKSFVLELEFNLPINWLSRTLDSMSTKRSTKVHLSPCMYVSNVHVLVLPPPKVQGSACIQGHGFVDI